MYTSNSVPGDSYPWKQSEVVRSQEVWISVASQACTPSFRSAADQGQSPLSTVRTTPSSTTGLRGARYRGRTPHAGDRGVGCIKRNSNKGPQRI